MNQIFDNQLFEAFAHAANNIYIYVTDIKQDVTRWSQGAIDLFGVDEYMHNTVETWTESIHPDDRVIYMKDMNAIASGEKLQHDCQYRARTKHGEYVWVECKGSVIKDSNGEYSLFAGIMTRLDNQNKYDSLTHLLTGFELARNSFEGNGSLMFVGIDGLRNINAQYGMVYGNKVLVYLGNLLTEKSLNATVYRFQGDEFAVYGTNMTADDMIRIFKEVYSICSVSADRNEIIGFGITAGIYEFSHEESSEKALSSAEICLNFAKKNQVDHYLVYSDEIEKKHIRRNMVSEELLKVIENDFKGFYLVYQPILANTGDTVVACEALIRWKTDNEQIGACYPDEFISILESNGGINELGYFVMRQAIKQAAVWQKKYKKFNVSFNVSYLQLEDPEFVPAIIETVDKYGVDPTGIVMELTESVLDVDTIMLKQSFEILKSKGIRIALDDFGTGNSSFWMLHNIDVDIVKLDQSFIRGLDTSGEGIDYAIVESVGLMCNRIGCKTVAEGVETHDIWKMISKFGFTGLQGYLFSRPIEVNDFEELLAKYDMCL